MLKILVLLNIPRHTKFQDKNHTTSMTHTTHQCQTLESTSGMHASHPYNTHVTADNIQPHSGDPNRARRCLLRNPLNFRRKPPATSAHSRRTESSSLLQQQPHSVPSNSQPPTAIPNARSVCVECSVCPRMCHVISCDLCGYARSLTYAHTHTHTNTEKVHARVFVNYACRL